MPVPFNPISDFAVTQSQSGRSDGLGIVQGVRYFRCGSPLSASCLARCRTRSQIASAILGSLIAGCQVFVAICEVEIIDRRSYCSSRCSRKSRRSTSASGVIDWVPLSLLSQLTASVPYPRYHTVRYVGVLSPRISWGQTLRRGLQCPRPLPLRSHLHGCRLHLRSRLSKSDQSEDCGVRRRRLAALRQPDLRFEDVREGSRVRPCCLRTLQPTLINKSSVSLQARVA
jgi:hypothetical protein